MPNNVYSKLKFIYHDDSGEKINQIAEFLKGEKTPLDFNKIIPGPEDPSCEWCRENWGTKWNAYDCSIKSVNNWNYVIYFKTAWSVPDPVLEKLFEMFPDVEINYISADDGGWFAYHITKGANEESVVREWKSENDPDGAIRAAIFEAMNNSY